MMTLLHQLPLEEVRQEVIRRANARMDDLCRMIVQRDWNLPKADFAGYDAYRPAASHTITSVFWRKLFGPDGCGTPWKTTRPPCYNNEAVPRYRTALIMVPREQAFIKRLPHNWYRAQLVWGEIQLLAYDNDRRLECKFEPTRYGPGDVDIEVSTTEFTEFSGIIYHDRNGSWSFEADGKEVVAPHADGYYDGDD